MCVKVFQDVLPGVVWKHYHIVSLADILLEL